MFVRGKFAKMARPTRSRQNATVSFCLRLTLEEHELIRAASKSDCYMHPSVWARKILLEVAKATAEVKDYK
jgi:hypothetical protein